MKVREFLVFVVILLVNSSAFVSAESDVAQKLDLASREIAGVRVYYDKFFETKLDYFEKAYRHFSADRYKAKEILARKDEIFTDINRILGITEPDAKMQNDFFTKFLGVFSGAKPVFYLVRQDKVKDFLRSGGELPTFTYNANTDIVEHRIELFDGSGKEPIGDFELTLPLDSEKTFEQEVDRSLKGLLNILGGPGSISLAIHEVTEMSLLKKVIPGDPYWRWFSDGFSDAITYELLKKHVSNEAAEEHAANASIEKYKDLEKQINLRYWMSGSCCVFITQTPIDYENRFTLARYAFAMFEAQRLIDKSGIECVSKIVDEVCSRKPKTSASLVEAIKKVTGEDMEKRFDRYQSFTTRQEGKSKYEQAYVTAAKSEDYEKTLFNLLRIMEFEKSPFTPDNLHRWMYCAWFLYELGHEKVGDEVMYKCMGLFKDSGIPNAYESSMERFVQYSLRCDNPKKSLQVAEELLKDRPDNITALTAFMLTEATSGKIPEAKQRAKRIQGLVKKGTEPYEIAGRVLTIDPNEEQ
ncbi:MAG: hypothetical protein ACYSWP_00555 [Planctomycetota bacterium]|jgi:hypothetical protein